MDGSKQDEQDATPSACTDGGDAHAHDGRGSSLRLLSHSIRPFRFPFEREGSPFLFLSKDPFRKGFEPSIQLRRRVRCRISPGTTTHRRIALERRFEPPKMRPRNVGYDGFPRDMAEEPPEASTRTSEDGVEDGALEEPLLERTEEGEVRVETPNLKHGFAMLYMARFLSAWGERMWEFGIALLLYQLRPQTLLLPSIFGLVDSATISVFGSVLGSWMDKVAVWNCFLSSVAFQNTMVLLSGGLIFVLLETSHNLSQFMFVLLTSLAILCGAGSSLGSVGSKICLEKKLARALTRSDSRALTKLNAGLRRIDLSCKILAPGVAGLLLTHGGPKICVLFIVTWNVAMWFPEILCVHYLLKKEEYSYVVDECKPRAHPTHSNSGHFENYVEAWKIYFSQDVCKAALSLALLFYTVLSFGSVMVPYLYSRGMTEATLGLYRGVGAVFGILATLSLSPMTDKLGLLWTGTIGVYMQLVCLFIGVVGILLGMDAVVSTHLLVVGVVLSRWGLWTFDMIVTQLIQEKVEKENLSAVSGAQNSLQNVLQLCFYLTSSVLSHPSQFWILCLVSIIAVFGSAVLFSIYCICG